LPFENRIDKPFSGIFEKIGKRKDGFEKPSCLVAGAGFEPIIALAGSVDLPEIQSFVRQIINLSANSVFQLIAVQKQFTGLFLLAHLGNPQTVGSIWENKK
jgi:hypothetical protein